MRQLTLYTTHTTDYSPVLPSCPERNTAQSLGFHFPAAYRWLYGMLGVERATWCYDRQDAFHIPLGAPMQIFTLRVPEDGVLAKINSDIWWHVCSDLNVYPEFFYDLSDAAYDAATKEWDQTHPNADAWKANIFREGDSMEYLLPNPVPPDWVVESGLVSGWEPREADCHDARLIRDPNDAIHWLRAALARDPQLHLRIKEDKCENGCQEWQVTLSSQPQPGQPPPRDHPLLRGLDADIRFL